MCALKHSNITLSLSLSFSSSLVHFNKCMRQSFEMIFTACDFSTFLAFELFSTTFFHLFYLPFTHSHSHWVSLSHFLYYGTHKTWHTAINLPWSINVNTNAHIQCEPLLLKEREQGFIPLCAFWRRERARDRMKWNRRWKVCLTHTVIPTLIFLLLSSSFLFILMFQQ